MPEHKDHTDNLGRELVLDELFDLTLYRALRSFVSADMRALLDQLIPIETRHLQFWQKFFSVPEQTVQLNLGRRIKLYGLLLFCRVFRDAGVALTLEAIELHGIKKYLQAWERYKNEPLGQAVKEILEDEFQHENKVVSDSIRQRVYPERIRDVFLGLNDGLVEMLGAVSGFFAAFQSPITVLAAACTVAVAGALSMAAGAFVAVGSQREMEAVEAGKRAFLGLREGEGKNNLSPSRPALSAGIVGVAYFIGALIPIFPVVFGARNVTVSLVAAVSAIIGVSYMLAFLSGMGVRRRIATNLVILALAVSVTYVIGTIANNVFGLAL